MGELTLLDKIKQWWWILEIRTMNYLLKKSGYDFGKYYMEELEKLGVENKYLIK
mgnify:CR=1 FL=1